MEVEESVSWSIHTPVTELPVTRCHVSDVTMRWVFVQPPCWFHQHRFVQTLNPFPAVPALAEDVRPAGLPISLPGVQLERREQ